MAGLLFAIAAAKLTVLFFFKEKLAEYDRQEKTYQAKRRDYEADIVSLPYRKNCMGARDSRRITS